MKRTIALLLALLMMLSAAIPAAAAEGEESPPPETVTAPAPDQFQEQEQEQVPEPPSTEEQEPPAPEETVPTPEETAPAPEETIPTEPTDEPSAPPAENQTPEATAEPSPEPSAEPEETPAPADNFDDLIALINVVPEASSELVLSISPATDLGDWTPTFTATLNGGQIIPELPADGSLHKFVGLAGDTTYTLKVTGPGFATYTQEIKLDKSDSALVQLTIGQRAGYGDKHPGILLLGDVDGSGTLEQNDKDMMMQAVAGVSAEGFTDFTGDGVTNLADAEYLARSFALSGQDPTAQQATVEHSVNAAAIASVASEGTTAVGVEKLFEKSEEKATLSPAGNDNDISADNPVEVSFGMADGAKTDGVIIEGSNITEGTILLVYKDQDGKEQSVMGLIGEGKPAAIVANMFPVTEVPEQEIVTFQQIAPAQEMAPVQEAAPIQEAVPAQEPVLTEGEEAVTIAALDLVPMAAAPMVMPEKTVQVTRNENGDLVLDLKEQVAVKRVTLTITATSDTSNLASISQVEFVNGMADRIPEPQMNIPADVKAAPGSRQFTVTWTPSENITGYEVEVSANNITEITSTSTTTLTVTNFNNDEVLNYTTYSVRVQSVNGAWKSGWSKPAVTVTPKPTGRPDKPDNVKAVGGYQTITVSWKNMKDTERYNLYYRAAGEGAFTKIPALTVTSYVLSGLSAEVETEYEVYVTGENEFGESPESMHASARTTTLNPPEMPKFNLINRTDAGVPSADHITSAVIPNTSGVMVNSPMDTDPGTAWGTVDGDPSSSYERATWNDGGWWNLSNSVGLIYTFDQAYTMDTIGMMSTEANMDFTYVRVRWWDAEGEHLYTDSYMRSERRTDSQGRSYFFLRMPEPITTDKIQIGVARYWAGNNRVAVSDVYFYQYDDLKRQINDLYADDLHTTLKETVTEDMLTALDAAIESSVDQFGNVNPDKEQLKKEMQTAWDIYRAMFLSKVTQVHTGITANGDEHGFGGLNAWQPLGVTAAAGEKITVYVGSNLRKTGENTNLELIITQYHAESSAMSYNMGTLKVGANEFQLPKIWSTSDSESGGALYVQYTGGSPTADEYAVRVNGGAAVPVLDLYGVTDAGERAARTSAYLTELSAYADGIEQKHSEIHQGEGSVSDAVNMDFVNVNCILGATDIMLDTMMLSLPAQQVVAGCNGDSATLLKSLDAMENMMHLFYQHKGLNAAAKDAVDQIPKRHLNIRYQRMFSGAFMYASGDHIGIKWPETAGMAGCMGVTYDGSGLYQSGNYFGWGIAHEIGHDINQGTYAIAEITNNYFAVLAQAQDTNGSVRFEYPKVYEKVTSGTTGRAGNVFTQLGMYWQLHLAYDKGWNFKTYDNYDEQLENLFWARVDTYARTPSKAPGELVIKDVDMDQALMRLCCAAAQKDILDFFIRWGKTPDEGTIVYASQFDKETRAIYYVCDDSRRYTLEKGGAGVLAADGTTEAISAVSAAVEPNASNSVKIDITPNGTVPAEDILGYEIVRCTISGGVPEKRTVGFTTESTFTDVIYAMNNRAVSYEVTLVDKYLNRSKVAESGMVKIQHNGVLAKDHWTVATAGLEAADIVTNGYKDENGNVLDPEVVTEPASTQIIDGDKETVYNGTIPPKEGETPAIEIDFHETLVITGFVYEGGTPVTDYGVKIRQNGEWVDVVPHAVGNAIYFSSSGGNAAYVSTYSADAMCLTLKKTDGTVTVAEIDVMGPSGDNVDFHQAGEGASIGYLSSAFKYGSTDEDVIPANSLVFTGTYKGNAAYNVVVLYDQDGKIVTGPAADGSQKAYQTILSNVPETGDIQDVADGTWIYWIEPVKPDERPEVTLPTRVRVELYRVNNAQTNEGQRLVSDSLFYDVPQTLGNITLSGGGAVG